MSDLNEKGAMNLTQRKEFKKRRKKYRFKDEGGF